MLHETRRKHEILKKKKNIYIFLIFKKFIKNSNNIPSISKTTQHTPMTWCTFLQSFEKIQQCVFELVRKLNVTDGRTGRRTEGVAILPGLRRRREIIRDTAKAPWDVAYNEVYSYYEVSKWCRLQTSHNKQGNSVTRDLPRTGSETNTTIFVIYILDIDSHCPYLLSGETTFQLTSC